MNITIKQYKSHHFLKYHLWQLQISHLSRPISHILLSPLFYQSCTHVSKLSTPIVFEYFELYLLHTQTNQVQVQNQ